MEVASHADPKRGPNPSGNRVQVAGDGICDPVLAQIDDGKEHEEHPEEHQFGEARRSGEFLEPEGVAELLDRHAHGSARSIVNGIYQDVKEFTSGQLHDDIALRQHLLWDSWGL